MNQISRREFVTLAAIGTTAAPSVLSRSSASAALTAGEIVDRIRNNVGVEWRPETVDTFKAGDPGTVATGIVTTAMATMDVLRQAVKAGANLVITCEPTFYARADTATPPARRGGGPGNGGRGASGAGARAGGGETTGAQAPSQRSAPSSPRDRVFAAKHDFIVRNNLVIWRFSDHWRLRRPDPLAQGLTDAFGWSRFRIADDPARVSIPAIRLDALVSQIKTKLNARGGIRVVGDPQTRVRRVGVLPGSSPIQASLKALPDVDVIVAGEVREWESVEYARDTVTAGGKKGLILLGRILSEDPGMNVCAQWLRTLVREITTTWIPVGDPYWRPL
ncbi:MAG: Nif3-like dinuclear metal center hexameric protein [Vicinamibacterales bacterium]